ncbi:MAG: hypothetical protein Kow0063_45050 [Anaerolineae bacterium]
MSFYDLRDALAQPGCAVCRLTAEATARYLDSLLWENVNDPGVRHDIRQARGFCHEHAWGLVRDGASLGVAIIMRDVLQEVLAILKEGKFQALPTLSLRRTQEVLDSSQPAAATAGLVRQLSPQSPCPACVQARTMENIYLSTLVEQLLGEDGLLAAYRASEGLCLPHFRQALARVRDETIFEALVNAQRAIWERLVSHLSEIIRKSDYRFQHEPRGEEVGGVPRAIAALSGPRVEKGNS